MPFIGFGKTQSFLFNAHFAFGARHFVRPCCAAEPAKQTAIQPNTASQTKCIAVYMAHPLLMVNENTCINMHQHVFTAITCFH